MSKHKTNFDESLIKNNYTFYHYLNRLTEIAISRFKWLNLPDTIDERFLELTLFTDGAAIFFEDEVGFLALQVTASGPFDVYRIPTRRRAYAANGYQRELSPKDSVFIWNNYLHSNSYPLIKQYAKRLYNLDRIIDVNANAQKTPVLITSTENQRLTLLNLYKEFDGNSPVIFGDKNIDLSDVTCVKTDAPYVSDKLYDLKTNLWNEVLTYLGISNISYQKKERMISDEVNRGQGGTIASRFSYLQARKIACDEINRKFGLDIKVDFRETFNEPTLLELEEGGSSE